MPLTAEQLTIIRSQLDPSAFLAGADVITQANARLAASGQAVVQSTTNVTKAMVDNAKQADTLARRIDSNYDSVVRFAAAQKTFSNAVALGNVPVDQANQYLSAYATKLGLTSAAHTAGTASAGNMAFAMRQLGVQSVQAISGIATGQSVLQVLIQQGHQIGDVMLSTGTGFGVLGTAAKAAFGAITSPIGLAVTAAATVTALGIAAESTARRMGALRNELSLIRTDFATASVAADQAARHLAATSPLSTADARSGINSVFGQGLFTGTQQQAEAIALEATKVATALGDVGKAASVAGSIVSNPSGVLADLLKSHPELTGFNQSLVDAVKRLQDTGHQGDAVTAAMDGLTRATKDQTMALSPLQDAVHRLDQAFTGAATGQRSLIDAMGTPFTTVAAGAVNGLASVVDAVNKARQSYAGLASIAALSPIGIYLASRANSTTPPIVTPTTPPGTAPAGTPATQLGVTQNDVATAVAQYFAGKGFNQAATAAILTNMAAESSLNPNKLNPDDGGSPSYGLVQYHGDRLTSLQQWSGTLTPSMQQQLDQIYTDLTSGAYQAVGKALQGLPNTSAGAALGTSIFTQGFEVPRNTAAVGAQRAAQAPGYFDRVGALASSGSLPGVAPNTLTNNQVAAGASTVFDQSVQAKRLKAEQDQRLADAASNLPGQDDDRLKAYAAALDAARKAAYDAVPAIQGVTRGIDIQIDSEGRVATAWGSGAAAAQHMANQIKAEGEARNIYAPNTAQFAVVVDMLTQKYNDLSIAQNKVAIAQQMNANGQQLDYLARETAAIGMNASEREVMLAGLRAENDLKSKGIPLTDAQSQKYIQQQKDIAAANQTLAQSKSAYDELANSASQSFDTIGNGIAQAMLSGQSAAVNFKNVMNTVVQQILQEFLKLSVLNPLLNSLFPGSQHRNTLSDVFDSVGKGNNGTPGSSSPGGANSFSGAGGLFGLAGRAYNSLFGTAGSAAAGTAFAGTTSAEAITFAGLGGTASGASAALAAAPGGFLHDGGIVGLNGRTGYVHPAVWDNAPRYHSGLGTDEFAAILQKGEWVLNGRQQRQVAAATANDGEASGKASATPPVTIHLNMPNVQNTDTFRKAAPQIAKMVGRAIQSSVTRSHAS